MMERPLLTSMDIAALQSLPPIQLNLDAATAFMLMATIQLASRHPVANQGPTVGKMCELARQIQGHLSVTQNWAALCEAGWDPACDVTTKGPPLSEGRPV